jgi:hypothetical protein
LCFISAYLCFIGLYLVLVMTDHIISLMMHFLWRMTPLIMAYLFSVTLHLFLIGVDLRRLLLNGGFIPRNLCLFSACTRIRFNSEREGA